MEEEMYFTDVAQIKTINELLRVDTRRDCVEDTDLVGLQQKVICGDFSLAIEMPADTECDFRFVGSTQRLLVVLLEEIGKHSRQEVKITVDSFIQRCNLSNRCEARKQLKIDLQCLAAIRFNLETKKKQVIRDCRLLEIAELRMNGIIYAKFSNEVITEWKDTLGLMQLPCLYFQLNRRKYQAAPTLLYYISLMRHISNKTILHKDILRIESLLAVTVLPTVEEVRQTKNGCIRERIVDRFFRELHALDSELKFKYTRNGKPISEAAVKKLRYEDFIDVCVHFQWVHETQFRATMKP